MPADLTYEQEVVSSSFRKEVEPWKLRYAGLHRVIYTTLTKTSYTHIKTAVQNLCTIKITTNVQVMPDLCTNICFTLNIIFLFSVTVRKEITKWCCFKCIMLVSCCTFVNDHMTVQWFNIQPFLLQYSCPC